MWDTFFIENETNALETRTGNYTPSIALKHFVQNPRVSFFKFAINRKRELKCRFINRTHVTKVEITKRKTITRWSKWVLQISAAKFTFCWKRCVLLKIQKTAARFQKLDITRLNCEKKWASSVSGVLKRKAYLPVSGMLSFWSVLLVHRYLIVLGSWIRRVNNKPFIWQWNAG